MAICNIFYGLWMMLTSFANNEGFLLTKNVIRLYDWSNATGLIVAEGQEAANERQRERYWKQRISGNKPISEVLQDDESDDVSFAECQAALEICSVTVTGWPCDRCRINNLPCNYAFVTSTPAVPSYRDRIKESRPSEMPGPPFTTFVNTFATDQGMVNDRGRSSTVEIDFGRLPNRPRHEILRGPPRDYSGPPMGGYDSDLDPNENQDDLEFNVDDWQPCDNCLFNIRACDNDGPPCRSCILHGVESTCNSAGNTGQTSQPQTPRVQSSGIQRGTQPDQALQSIESTDPWARMQSMLDAGIPLTSGAEDISPHLAAPPPQPIFNGGVSKNVPDQQLGFTPERRAPANSSADLRTQSQNWLSREGEAVWSRGAKYNAYGQELDMHGSIVPGGRIFNGVVDPDPDQPINSIENDHSRRTSFNVRTQKNDLELTGCTTSAQTQTQIQT